MTNEYIQSIIEKYLNGQASEEEIFQLDTWYQSLENRPSVSTACSQEELKAASQRMFKTISEKIDELPEPSANKEGDGNAHQISGQEERV